MMVITSIQQTRYIAKQKTLLYIECYSKTARGSATKTRTRTETQIEIGIDSQIDSKMEVEIEIEIETQEECAPHSDHNVNPLNQIAAKAGATCQQTNASVKIMEDCVSIKEEKITFAAQIDVVMMECARVLPWENPVL